MNPLSDKKVLGNSGEALAAEHLIKNGYHILEKNFRAKTGEIDIIAQEDGVICFVEVKTRVSFSCGEGLEAISRLKRRSLCHTAEWYLQSKDLSDRDARFDILAITMRPDGTPVEYELVKNAFETSDTYD